MKTSNILFAVFLALTSISSQAQVKKNIYRIRVELLNGDILKGHLFEFNDSSIRVLLGRRKNVDTTVFIQHVKNVALRRKHAPARGIFGGMGVGAGAGAIIGYASYSPPDCDGSFICFDFGPEFSAIIGGFVGTWTGGIIGLVTHIGYKNFALDGEMMKYDLLKKKILSGPSSTLEAKPIH